MIPQLARMLTHRVTVSKMDRDYTGKLAPTETTEGVPAFVQYGKKVVVDRQGEEVLAAAVVFLGEAIDPSHEHWQITQTAPYTRGVMTVISIDPIDDPRTGKTHHYEVSVR